MNAKTIAIALLIVAAALPSGIPRLGLTVALASVALVAAGGLAFGCWQLRKKACARKTLLQLHTAEEHDDELPKAA